MLNAVRVAQSLVLCIVFCLSFCLFVIALSVLLWITTSLVTSSSVNYDLSLYLFVCELRPLSLPLLLWITTSLFTSSSVNYDLSFYLLCELRPLSWPLRYLQTILVSAMYNNNLTPFKNISNKLLHLLSFFSSTSTIYRPPSTRWRLYQKSLSIINLQ